MRRYRFCRCCFLLGAVGMLSPLRVPKLGRLRSRALTVVLAVTVAFGYGAGLFHRLPEYMLAGGLVYLGACVLFHLARASSLRSSISSSDRGQSPCSRRDSARSASSLPPVWQRAQ